MKHQLKAITLTTFALGILGANPVFGQVLNGDHIVEGQLCASQGSSCVNPESYPTGGSFNADFKAKDDYPVIYFEDINAGEEDWRIIVDTDSISGVPSSTLSFQNYLNTTDTDAHVPLVMEEGGPNFQLYLHNSGNVGLGTNMPARELDIASPSPTIRLTDTDGVADWEINSNPASTVFDIVNVTNNSKPLRLDHLAPTHSLTVNNSGNVGLGIQSGARQLHLLGSNAVFRMDRSTDTAAFLMVRTDGAFNPWKTFVVGTNASGPNNGEFIINDLGQATAGGGARRMTITNAGNVFFTGSVFAPGYGSVSSRELKDNIQTISNPLETVSKLRGVRFDWKESGEPALGFIAEEVADVLPEVVIHDEETGETTGMSYLELVPVLVEAVKAQQAELDRMRLQVLTLESIEARLMKIEARLGQEATDQLVVSR
jgi:hypothetical protein